MADEVQSSPAPEKKSDGKNKSILILGLVILAVVLVGALYFFRDNLPGMNGSADVSPTPVVEVQETSIEAVFTCDDDKTITATFKDGASSSVDLVLFDGTAVSLPRAVSGSGARYANEDESIVFWNSGNTAFLEENGTQTYSNCETEPQS